MSEGVNSRRDRRADPKLRSSTVSSQMIRVVTQPNGPAHACCVQPEALPCSEASWAGYPQSRQAPKLRRSVLVNFRAALKRISGPPGCEERHHRHGRVGLLGGSRSPATSGGPSRRGSEPGIDPAAKGFGCVRHRICGDDDRAVMCRSRIVLADELERRSIGISACRRMRDRWLQADAEPHRLPLAPRRGNTPLLREGVHNAAVHARGAHSTQVPVTAACPPHHDHSRRPPRSSRSDQRRPRTHWPRGAAHWWQVPTPSRPRIRGCRWGRQRCSRRQISGLLRQPPRMPRTFAMSCAHAEVLQEPGDLQHPMHNRRHVEQRHPADTVGDLYQECDS